MAAIFLSYRRSDSAGHAGRIYDHIAARFGADAIFMDVDDLEAGHDFARELDRNLADCQVLVVVMGPRWATVQDTSGQPRLADPKDFVRREVETGLARGIPIVPVLIGGAQMPPPDTLPPEVQGITRMQAIELDDRRFTAEAAELAQSLDKLIGRGKTANPSPRRRWMQAGAAVAVAAAAWLVVVGPQGLKLALPYVEPSSPAAEAAVPPPPEPEKLPDLSGTWRANVRYGDRVGGGRTFAEWYKFEARGGGLTGTASFFEIGREIQNGHIDGNRLTFETKWLLAPEDQGIWQHNRYRGVIDGDSIRMTYEEVSSPRTLEFVATRSRQ